MNHRWTTEEEDILRQNYKQDDNTARSIGITLGVTKDAVKCKANRLGLSNINANVSWTKQEERKLETLVGKYTTSTIARLLGRSVCAVARRTTLLHISRRTRNGWFTQDETCKILGVGHHWLQNRIASKELKATKDGSWEWRIWEKDLKLFIRKYPMELNGRNVDFLMIVDILSGVINQ